MGKIPDLHTLITSDDQQQVTFCVRGSQAMVEVMGC